MDKNTETERDINLFTVTQLPSDRTSELCGTRANGCREVIVGDMVHPGLDWNRQLVEF